MANPWVRDRATRFYLTMALCGLVVALIGFSTTYVLPMATGRFAAPWYVHIHGAACLAWLLLFILQSGLVRIRRSATHRRLGVAAMPVAITIWAAGIATANWSAARDLPTSGAAATSSLLGTFNGLTIFLMLVLAAIALRRRPDWHKRLLVLATIQLLWPAFFRLRHLLPMIPRPEIWLALVVAYSPILIAAYRDHRRFDKIHPVWLFLAPALIAEQTLEVLLFDNPPWRAVGQTLFELLN